MDYSTLLPQLPALPKAVVTYIYGIQHCCRNYLHCLREWQLMLMVASAQQYILDWIHNTLS